MKDPWLGFVNEQVAQTTMGEAQVERFRLRQTILDRTACSFPFPLEISFRAVVDDRVEHAHEDYLLVEPEGLCEEAIEVIGGVLLPTERRLQPGSVVQASCHLADPDTYWTDQGVLAEDAEIDALVPIER